MTTKQKYDQSKEWQEKALLVNFYHCLMTAKSKRKWTVRLTAVYFQKSIGLISEDIKLAKNIEFVRKLEFRKDALHLIK